MSPFRLPILAAALGLAGLLASASLASAATITPQVVTAGAQSVILTHAAASGGGDFVTNTAGGVVIVVENQAVSSQTVTVASNATNIPPGTAKTNLAVVCAAASVCVIGPLDKSVWNNVSGQIALTYSAVVTLFVSAYTH